MIIIFILLLYFSYDKKSDFKSMKKNNIYLDKFETHIYNNIKYTITKNKCSEMWDNQREFLNGVIRKFRPKKIVEIGVAKGGGTSIILNAIKDIKNSHLYSIDLSSNEKIGICVKKYFPEYLNKWSLFTGNIAAYFIEKIGDNIDMVFIDSAHFEPGEILDFLIILPFVKERAIIGFHDIGNQITKAGKNNTRREWAPYLIFNIIKGQKYFPSGNYFLTKDIGVIKLEKNQKKYIHDYFRALGGQWQYFPKENHIKIVKTLFNKYYDNTSLAILNEAIEFNRKFVKNNPMKNLYRDNSD